MADRWMFFHGWALGPWYFKGFLEQLPEAERAQSWAFDRGYFGAPSGAPPAVEGAVVVAHSFGLHWVPPEALRRARALVVLAGFLRFHPQEERARKVSQRGLRNLKTGLEQDLPGALESFYRLCCAPGPCGFFRPAAGHRARLAADLEALDQAELDPARLAHAPRTLLVHGAEDQVVAPQAADELACRLSGAEVRVLPAQGHALGFGNPADLHEVVRSWLA